VGKEAKTSHDKGSNSPHWNAKFELYVPPLNTKEAMRGAELLLFSSVDDDFAGVVLRCYEKGAINDRFIGIATIRLANERLRVCICVLVI